jgi:hypothetical protein
MRLILALLLAAYAAAWSPSTLHAALLLDDTWADADRTDTSLPSESAVYVSAAANAAVSAGSLSYTQSTGSQRLHTHFAPAASPVTIGVGQKLIASIDFLARDGIGTATNRNFRVGLFRDPDGTQVTADGYNDGGGTGSPWANAQGYASFFYLSTAPAGTNLFQHGKRNGSSTSLLGAGGDYAQASSGGGAATAALDTLYTLTIELDRKLANQVNVTFRLADATGVLSTQTVVDSTNGAGEDPSGFPVATTPYTTFDTLAMRFSSSTATANRREFRRIRVELTPEPTSAALLAGGALALAAVRRRR